MYRYTKEKHIASEKFEFPTEIKLDENNRWVILAKLIPWQEFEGEYAANFDEKMGAPAKSFRMALGSWIIQEILGSTDRETVDFIKENPYLQYFLGLKNYEYKIPFDPSTLVFFRKRINREKVAKKRRCSRKERRKAIKKQLKYIERNLGYIEELIAMGSSLKLLSKKEKKDLLVIKEMWKQQSIMYEEKSQSIPQRIVSIDQEYIRPIVRGKAGKNVEFGAKVSASCVDGYVFLDHLDWENFNESKYLIEQVEKYKKYFGYYPSSIHVDKIYRTRENRKYCQEKNIRMSGPKLGRPRKNVSIIEKKQAQKDERKRNEIEGKFGQGKRRYGLNLIKTKLKETSETKIAISFLVMNLMTLLLRVKRGFLCLFLGKQLNLSILHKFSLCLSKNKIRYTNLTKEYSLCARQAC